MSTPGFAGYPGSAIGSTGCVLPFSDTNIDAVCRNGAECDALMKLRISAFDLIESAHEKRLGCFSFISLAMAIVAQTSTSASWAPTWSIWFSAVRSVSLNDGAPVSGLVMEKSIPCGRRSLVALTRLMMSHLDLPAPYSLSYGS